MITWSKILGNTRDRPWWHGHNQVHQHQNLWEYRPKICGIENDKKYKTIPKKSKFHIKPFKNCHISGRKRNFFWFFLFIKILVREKNTCCGYKTYGTFSVIEVWRRAINCIKLALVKRHLMASGLSRSAVIGPRSRLWLPAKKFENFPGLNCSDGRRVKPKIQWGFFVDKKSPDSGHVSRLLFENKCFKFDPNSFLGRVRKVENPSL